MAGKKRTVRFYIGVEYNGDDEPHPWQYNKWLRVFRNCQGSQPSFNVKGTDYVGEYKKSIVPAAEYLHLMRRRPLADWPEGRESNGTISNLGINRASIGISEIYEYAYLLPIDGTPYVAVFSSSGGPRPAAIADWLSVFANIPQSGGRFELEPVLRTNAIEKLNSAIGVSSLYVRFEGDASDDSDSRVERAAACAAQVPNEHDHADAKIEIMVAVGKAEGRGPVGDGMRKELSTLARKINPDPSGRGLTKLVAKTLQKQDDGSVKTEPVDFIKQIITVTKEFGDSMNDAMTPDQILSGMYEAIREFRERTNEY